MIFRRTLLTRLMLTGAVSFGAGCSSDRWPDYSYDGFIDGNQVESEEVIQFKGIHYTLEVTKPDGTRIKFVDRLDNDFHLEYVIITTSKGQTTKYQRDSKFGQPVVEEAQNQFDIYLQKILEKKTVDGLTALRNEGEVQ